MIITNDYGQAQFSGTLTTLTAAKGLSPYLININGLVTHWVPYSTGGTAALIDNEVVTGGTSNATARIVRVVRDNGTGGSSDTGMLLLRAKSGTFQAETLTGGTSTGTCVIASNLFQIISWSQPKTLLVTVQTEAVNVCFDGTTPTATAGTNLGHQLTSGQSIFVTGTESIKNFKAINAVNGNNAIVKYSLYF
jgi:hypothetical protein